MAFAHQRLELDYLRTRFPGRRRQHCAGGLEDGQYSLTLTTTNGKGQVGSKTISFNIGEQTEVSLPGIPRTYGGLDVT
jgi:hypothetical protein